MLAVITAGGDILQMTQALPGSVVNILMAVMLFVVLGRPAGARVIAAFARSLLSGAVVSGTPLLYATLAELIGERAGVVNLGLEGVMLVGAVVGFVDDRPHRQRGGGRRWRRRWPARSSTLLFAFLVVDRRANQLATGLALMFCGVGLSALLGAPYVGSQIAGLPELRCPGLADLPVLGPRALRPRRARLRGRADRVAASGGCSSRTRWGLALRAVGREPGGGVRGRPEPRVLQYQALLLAGVLGGIAGAHLSLGVARTWAEWMTAGRGFIAVALVIFATWQPLRAIAGALLFGGAISLQLQLQARGVPDLAVHARHAAVRAEPRRAGGLGRRRAPCRAREPRPRVPGITMMSNPGGNALKARRRSSTASAGLRCSSSPSSRPRAGAS